MGYWRRHKTLHYIVWNSRDDINSVFVKLAIIKGFKDREHDILFNLAEMWMACAFQTLQATTLERFLPTTSRLVHAGLHLNIAWPLWQPFSNEKEDFRNENPDRQSFCNYLTSSDPITREWAHNCSDSFNDLRNSPRKALHDYWLELHGLRCEEAYKAIQIQKNLRYQKVFIARD